MLSSRNCSNFLPVGKDFAISARNFLPVGKQALALMRADDIIDILSPIRANLGACCVAEDARLVVAADPDSY